MRSIQPVRPEMPAPKMSVICSARCPRAGRVKVAGLVISLPARGGYGLPTAYFLLQGVAMGAERKLRHGRRLFAWVVVAGPVFWLFHPLFVRQVIIPMMEAMRAI